MTGFIPPMAGRMPQGGDPHTNGALLCPIWARTVLIVGGDIPDIDRRHITKHSTRSSVTNWCSVLRRRRLPLVGAAQGARIGTLFEDVRWSTKFALADTLNNVRPSVRVGMLGELDIDDGEAYAAWRRPS